MAQAGIEGSWPSNGVLNVTFSKPRHQAVSTVSNLNESWVFNADKTFTRGGMLRGTWKQRLNKPKLYEASYDLSAYANHLTNFWAERGVTVSNVRILKSILQIRKVSNGLSGEEFLKYKMDVTEISGVRTATVVIRGSFVAPNGASENTALSRFFPTMWQGQSNASSSSFVMNGFITAPIYFEGINTNNSATFILQPVTPIKPQ